MADLGAVSALAHRRTGAGPAVMACPALRVSEHVGLAVFALTVDVGRHPKVRALLEAALGARLPTAEVPSGGDPMLIWQGPNDCLIVGEPAAVRAAATAAETALDGCASLVCDVSDGLVVIDLSGPAAIAVCPPPWPGRPDGPRSAVGRLADLRVTRLHLDDGHIRLFAERPDADYLWAWLEMRLQTLA
jgi:hypothetical protein